jgi:hypothetical protein
VTQWICDLTDAYKDLVVPKPYYFFFIEGGRYEKTSSLVDIVFIIFYFFEQLCKCQDTKHSGDKECIGRS